MLPVPLSASTSQACSTRLRSPLPYSPTMFDDQEHDLSAVAAPFTTSALAMTNLSPDTQRRATTTATRSCDLPQRLRLHGRTTSNCLSPRRYTIADMHVLAAPTCPVSPLSLRHQPSPTNLDLHSCLRKTTKTFPSPHSRSTSHTSQRRRFDHELRVRRRQTLPAQLVFVRGASLLLAPPVRRNMARTIQPFSCTWQHHRPQFE